MKTKKFLALVLSLAMIFTLAACGGNDGNKEEADTANEGNASEISGTLNVVCTNESYMALFDMFTAETGVDVEFLSMSSGEVLAKIEAEGNSSSADMWFGGGVDAFMEAKSKGYLAPMTFDALENFDTKYKDEENYWVSKGLTVAGFVVNDDIAKSLNLPYPEKWTDLTDPVYKSEILMSNPAISGTNYAVVNALLQKMGEEDGWAFWEAVNKNIEYYSRRGSDPVNKTSAGEFAIGITYLDGTVDKLAEENGLTIVYPSDGIPFMPDGVAVFANSKNEPAAHAFVEWLFSSNDNMLALAEIDQKDTIKAVIPSLEGIELTFDTDTLIDVDLSLYGSQREALLERWTPMMGDKVENE